MQQCDNMRVENCDVLWRVTWFSELPGGRKILFHEYAAKLINPENPPRLPHEISTLAQDCKAWKRMEVDCWHHWEPPWAPEPS